jgi:hypothetical protein
VRCLQNTSLYRTLINTGVSGEKVRRGSLFVFFFHLSLFKAIMTGKTKKIQKCFFLLRIINNFAETMQVSRLKR